MARILPIAILLAAARPRQESGNGAKFLKDRAETPADSGIQQQICLRHGPSGTTILILLPQALTARSREPCLVAVRWMAVGFAVTAALQAAVGRRPRPRAAANSSVELYWRTGMNYRITAEGTLETGLSGFDLINFPMLNKGTAFTETERTDFARSE